MKKIGHPSSACTRTLGGRGKVWAHKTRRAFKEGAAAAADKWTKITPIRSHHELTNKFACVHHTHTRATCGLALAQLYANALRFDEEGYPLSIGKAGWHEATSPRANFDSFLWAFVTIFQVSLPGKPSR